MVLQASSLWGILIGICAVLIVVAAVPCLIRSRKNCARSVESPSESFVGNRACSQSHERTDARQRQFARSQCPRKPKAGSKTNCEKFLRHGYVDKSEASEAENCPICLGPLVGRVSHGHCLHRMHSTCIRGWLAKDANATCPTCRVEYIAFSALKKESLLQSRHGQALNKSASELPTNLEGVLGLVANSPHASAS